MADSWDETSSFGSQSEDSIWRMHIEPIYESFVCPLTKQVMCDPVAIENGRTFEREAIEKWFKECKDNGRKPVCPLTFKELRTTDLSPSIALRNTIEEWTTRNEAAQLDMAQRSLTLGGSEGNILQALKYIQHICHRKQVNKHAVRHADLIPKVVDVLKSPSRSVRCKALETLRFLVEENDDNKVVMGLLLFLKY